MNTLCFSTSLSSSDMAAWAQACVGALAIVVGAAAIYWQVRRSRLELSEREARLTDGLARLLVHLKDSAVEARAEKRKMKRWPLGHPAEPSSLFAALSEAVRKYPLESLAAEVQFEAVLNAQRVSAEIWPLVDPAPELDVNSDYERTFENYIGILEQQISLLRIEASELLAGRRARHSAAAT